MLPCMPSPPASSTRTASILLMLKGMILSGANCWPRPPAHPPNPAASQPFVKELWPAPLQCRWHRDRNGQLVSSNAWTLPGKTVQASETCAVEKGAEEKESSPKFLVLSQARNRPCFQAMGHEELFKIWLVHSKGERLKDVMPRQRPIHVARWPNNGT